MSFALSLFISLLLSTTARAQTPSATPCAENKDPAAQCGIELPKSSLHLCIGERCFDITESSGAKPMYRWIKHAPGAPSESGKISLKDFNTLKKAAGDFAKWAEKNTKKPAAAMSSSTSADTTSPVCTLPLYFENHQGTAVVTRDVCQDALPKAPAEERVQALLRLFNSPTLLKN
jgi:hypothetical protein